MKAVKDDSDCIPLSGAETRQGRAINIPIRERFNQAICFQLHMVESATVNGDDDGKLRTELYQWRRCHCHCHCLPNATVDMRLNYFGNQTIRPATPGVRFNIEFLSRASYYEVPVSQRRRPFLNILFATDRQPMWRCPTWTGIQPAIYCSRGLEVRLYFVRSTTPSEAGVRFLLG